MKQHSLIIFILLTACSKDEPFLAQQSRKIAFECSGEWQKGTRTIGTNDYCQDISISAAWFESAWSADCTPNFMHKQKAVLSGSSYGFEGGAYWYWPNSGKLRFFAYGPYDAVSSGISTASATGAPTVNFTCPQPIGGQYDLQYAQSSDYECATGNVVNLPFNHLLSALAVTMNSAVGTVESVTLQNIASTGTYTPGSGWSNQGGTTNFSWNNPTDGSGLFVALIPQNLAGTSAKLVATFTLKSDNSQHTMTYDLGGNNIVWDPATIYHYEIEVESGTFIPTGPEPTTDIVIGIAGWEIGGVAIIAGSSVYDSEGNLSNDVHNFIYTQTDSYTSNENPSQSSINFVYTENTNITGYPATAANETNGTAENGDENTNINSFDNSGEGHDANGRNENDPESTDGTTINSNNTDYDPGTTDNNPDTSDQSGYDNSSITGYPDNATNETGGTAENGDESTNINGFDDSGEGHTGYGKNEGNTEDSNNNNNEVHNNGGNNATEDYDEGANTNGDGNTSDSADQSDQSGYDGSSITNFPDNPDNETDGTAENGDGDSNINSFEQGNDDHTGYAHADTNSNEAGNNGAGEGGQNRSEPNSPSPAPSNSPTRSNSGEGGNNHGEDNES